MRKIHQLEGVRGIGCMIVFVCHFQIVFFPQFYHLVLGRLQTHLPLNASNFIVYMMDLSIIGNMFLHIFWALSAYVIFKKFFELSSKDNLLASTVKRYFRLMIPCAVSIFFSYFLFTTGLIYVRGVTKHVLQQNLYAFEPSFWRALQNSVWDTFFDYNYADSYNGPLWTIAREFYGSVFCFGLFGVIGTAKNRSYFYVLIFVCAFLLKMYWLNSFLFGYYLSDYDFSVKHYSSPITNIVNRVNTFITSHQVITVILFLLLFTAIKYNPYHHPENLDVVNSFLSIGVILISLRIDAVSRLMSFPILTKLGQVSFGLYLLHWPFMCAFTSWYYLKFDHSTYLHLGELFALTLIFSMTLAWLFYRYIDITSIKLSGRVAKYFNKLTKDDVPELIGVHAHI
jgi:peptidoglycan/LPS O-acetylase OafA/YrhL